MFSLKLKCYLLFMVLTELLILSQDKAGCPLPSVPKTPTARMAFALLSSPPRAVADITNQSNTLFYLSLDTALTFFEKSTPGWPPLLLSRFSRVRLCATL